MKTLEEAVHLIFDSDSDYVDRSHDLLLELSRNIAVIRALLAISCADTPMDAKLITAMNVGYMVGREMEKS